MQHGNALSLSDPCLGDGGKSFRKFRQPRLLNRNPGRAGMATECHEQVSTGCQCLIQVETWYGPSRPFSDTLFIYSDDDRRAMEPFHDTGGHDTDDPEVPSSCIQHDAARPLSCFHLS